MRATRNKESILIQNIKDIGQFLIDDAEKIVNDFNYDTNLIITCYPCEIDRYPHIFVETRFVPEKIIKKYYV